MTEEKLLTKVQELEKDGTIQNLIAQANARYILLNTSEAKDNFPAYTFKDEFLDLLSYRYINLGCSLAEMESYEAARLPLEKGAVVLEYCHASENNPQEMRSYHGIIAAMSYYASFQYSKAFVLANKFGQDTKISSLVSLFLRRKYIEMEGEAYKIIVDENYTDEAIANDEELSDNIKIYEVCIAKSLLGFLAYFNTGQKTYIENATEMLRDLKGIAEIENDPGIWWVLRLLLIISEGISEASLWNSMSPYFDLKQTANRKYLNSLLFSDPKVCELFITQRKAIANALSSNEKGCVISMPTSSGKTRIAELAILKCLNEDAGNKILYIAPYRSLAFELESGLERAFGNTGFTVSHLYGGSLYNKLDEEAINDSNVVIATPEKAKAILRSDNTFLDSVKLIVLDEGHLLGNDRRLIQNEIFYEELRYQSEKNGGNFLLLSAVLPNSNELASWLTKSDTAVYKDTWRPSDERIGILDWDGSSVTLRWESSDTERKSFNPNFVVAKTLPLVGRQRKVRFKPESLNDAVAATAVKLQTFGTCLIYVPKKDTVFSMARLYLSHLLEEHDHVWKNEMDWRTFELSCIENYGEKSEWVEFAKKGILCHNADLPSDVRLPMEKLMRGDRAKVIICTSTLGQGVNLGVSSVIFTGALQKHPELKLRDFWNIAGRAGRSFVDHEGKILVALESVNDFAEGTREWYVQNRKNDWKSREVKKFFAKDNMDLAQSGVLSVLSTLKAISEQNGVDFDTLLQLIAENHLADLNKVEDDKTEWEAEKAIVDADSMDDTLLSLHFEHTKNGEPTDVSWVDGFFRNSLAYIQASRAENISNTEVIKMLESRAIGILKKVGTNRKEWASTINSGVPLDSDIFIRDSLDNIISTTNAFLGSQQRVEDSVAFLKSLEEILGGIPALAEEGARIMSLQINEIRTLWLNGSPMSEINSFQNSESVIAKLYSFKLPWILNAAAKKMRHIDMDDQAEAIEALAVLVEYGLPSLVAVKIHQAGIRSRTAATELSFYYDEDDPPKGFRFYRKDIIRRTNILKKSISKLTGEWIDLMEGMSTGKRTVIDKLPIFKLSAPEDVDTLVAKEIGGEMFLLSLDGEYKKKIVEEGARFSKVIELSGVYFKRIGTSDRWMMSNENPYVELRE